MKAKEKAKLLNWKADDGAAKHTRVLALLAGDNPAGAGLYANWGEVDADTVLWFVQVMALHGGAVLLGVSRDSTQYHIKIYIGKESPNKWFSGNDEGRELLHQWMRATCEALTEGR